MIPPNGISSEPNGGEKPSAEGGSNGTGNAQANQAQQPPLGRNASAGDSQPQIAARQLSEGGAEPPRTTLAAANGGSTALAMVGAARTGAPSPASVPAGPTVAAEAEKARENPFGLPAGHPPQALQGYPPTAAAAVAGRSILDQTAAQREAYEREIAAKEPPSQQPPVSEGARHPPTEIAAPPMPAAPPTATAAATTGAAAIGVQQAPAPPAAEPAAANAQGPPGGGGMRELRVEDALLYLDEVKRQFGDRPRVYNEFLGIMKNFKSQEVDTPGVIARVSKLFRGYNNLILGFNKFLPNGYKIGISDIELQEEKFRQEDRERDARERAARERAALAVGGGAAVAAGLPPAFGRPGFQQPGLGGLPPTSYPGQPPAPKAPQPPAIQGRASFQAKPPQAEPPAQHPPARPVTKFGGPGAGVTSQPRPAAQPPGSAKSQQPSMGAPPQRAASQQRRSAQPPQTVEFDHAISYVTTIKRRFANDPSTYHQFLEILHTYQTEQRGIKDVLEKVAHLFQDHPDLLKEFTFFLPDAVQDQAKERLHRAAHESEERQAAKRAQVEKANKSKEKSQDMDIDTPDKSQRFIDMTSQQAGAVAGEQRGKKRSANDQVKDTPIPIALPQQPETWVYNAAVERQFFDAAREALMSYTRDGGQAWAEFLKCLDMYAQEILSRNEMLTFVEPLLGKRNTKLFEEFKRILAAAGAQSISIPNPEDSWHSVPLSEIDFTRCRRCSPSYRALPRDYPLPPCSDRSDEENKCLNDIWVSLPVGSEESYTFRHMRRNTYEETLFRCEDERFEIDMTIDSNAVTLARLEPIAEEISQLAENELVVLENGVTPKPAPGGGLGGKKFEYTFDKTILTVVHRNSITRIYGDSGQEMLDLIVKNPTVAIPVVVERLRQKDREWRAVRDRLNIRWRELAEHNYYRSLDHRSLTWRTTDKRAISTRTLIFEIKDRAANRGKEGEAAFQARLDKAKEEHGGFFEVTMGESFRRNLDLTNLPKPDRRIFTPHLSLMHENTDWVHRDAYRILSFALERGSISPVDKERCHRLWTDFLGPMLNLSMHWMLAPSATFQQHSKPMATNDFPSVVSNDDDSPDEEMSLDEDGQKPARVVKEDGRNKKPTNDNKDDSPAIIDHHPLPAGATVSTLYGEGRIVQYKKSDDTYVVRLAFGMGHLRPTAILCSVVKAEHSNYTEELRLDDPTKLERPDDMLAIGTQSLYLFFRLHDILIKRLGDAKRVAHTVLEDGSLINMVEQMPGDDAAVLGRRRYDAFLSLVYALLDGGSMGSAAEGGKYEDRVRSLLGHRGYMLATMDKLISHILKNLQTMANDDTMWSLVQLFRRHMDSGSFKPEAFRQEAAHRSDGEPMYAFQLCPMRDENKAVLHMEYLGVISETEEEDVATSEEPPIDVVPPAKRSKRDK